MEIIIALLILPIWFGYSYWLAEVKGYGVLTSVSASSYVLPKDERKIFYGVLTVVGLINMAMVLTLGSFAFLASVGLMFAGVTLNHSRAPGKIPHTVGTILSIVATFVGIIWLFGIWLPASLAAIGSLLIFLWPTVDNKIWYIEHYNMALAMITYIWLYVNGTF